MDIDLFETSSLIKRRRTLRHEKIVNRRAALLSSRKIGASEKRPPRAAKKEFGTSKMRPEKRQSMLASSTNGISVDKIFICPTQMNLTRLRGEVFMLSTIAERARELLERLKELGDAL